MRKKNCKFECATSFSGLSYEQMVVRNFVIYDISPKIWIELQYNWPLSLEYLIRVDCQIST